MQVINWGRLMAISISYPPEVFVQCVWRKQLSWAEDGERERERERERDRETERKIVFHAVKVVLERDIPRSALLCVSVGVSVFCVWQDRQLRHKLLSKVLTWGVSFLASVLLMWLYKNWWQPFPENLNCFIADSCGLYCSTTVVTLHDTFLKITAVRCNSLPQSTSVLN